MKSYKVECYESIPENISCCDRRPIRVLELGWKCMIKLLAKFFRGLHLIFGVSAPPEGQNERTFVLIWLGILAFLVGFAAALTYFLPYLYFKK